MKYDKKKGVQCQITGKFAQSARGTFMSSQPGENVALVQPDLRLSRGPGRPTVKEKD